MCSHGATLRTTVNTKAFTSNTLLKELQEQQLISSHLVSGGRGDNHNRDRSRRDHSDVRARVSDASGGKKGV